MSFPYVNVNCMHMSLFFVNRMTLFIVYKSFIQLMASKSKLFISQTENYNMKKLETTKLGLSKQKVSIVGTRIHIMFSTKSPKPHDMAP